MEDSYFYVVRGAKMRCDCGSHARQINLPVSHGSFVLGQPMMNEGDYQAEQNISTFGICSSPSNPNKGIIYLVAENGGTISGTPCVPNPLPPWINTKEKTRVDGLAALTTQSFLICAYRGVIRFISNGQQNE